MTINIKPWDHTDETTQSVLSLVRDIFPLANLPNSAEALTFLTDLTKGFEESFMVAMSNDGVVGFGFLTSGPDQNTVSMTGCVAKSYRRKGVGGELLHQLIKKVQKYADRLTLTTSSYASDLSGKRFLEKAGFSEIDQVFWSECPADVSFPAWCLQKEKSPQIDRLHFMTGSDYKEQIDDWAQKLWALDTESARDIPSAITFERMPFDEWKKLNDSDFANFDQAIVALDESLPVGVIKIGMPGHEKININYTGVARSHRRIGLSTVLKMKVFHYARKNGARWLTTQNHKRNPIYDLNLAMGFETIETIVEYARPLDKDVDVGN